MGGKVGNVITVGDNVGACTTGGNDPSTTNVNILQDMLARVPPIQSPTQTTPTACWTPRSIRFPPSELEMHACTINYQDPLDANPIVPNPKRRLERCVVSPSTKQAWHDNPPCDICGAIPADLRTHMENAHLP